MRRPYSAREYVELAGRIRSIKRDVHIAADVIVGFPSEDEKDFEATLGAVERAGCASMHVFTYSARKETAAARMKDDVSNEEKKTRSRRAISLAEELNLDFRKRYEGRCLDAILERRKGGFDGITGNYIRIAVGDVKEELNGKMLPVRIKEVYGNRTCGELMESG